MSIQNIAKELYKAQQKVEHLEKEVVTLKGEEQRMLENELRMAQQELAVIRKILDGQKEQGLKRIGSFKSSL